MCKELDQLSRRVEDWDTKFHECFDEVSGDEEAPLRHDLEKQLVYNGSTANLNYDCIRSELDEEGGREEDSLTNAEEDIDGDIALAARISAFEEKVASVDVLVERLFDGYEKATLRYYHDAKVLSDSVVALQA